MSNQPSSSPSFAAGQVWKYKTRKGESDSRVTIVSIDHDDPEYGDIVHIYISGLEIPNPTAPGGKTLFISHLPYAAVMLKDSLTELESQLDDLESDLEQFDATQEGYSLWKKAFENSEAGVFTNPVADAIGFVEESVQG
jgi:hypothetical protein